MGTRYFDSGVYDPLKANSYKDRYIATKTTPDVDGVYNTVSFNGSPSHPTYGLWLQGEDRKPLVPEPYGGEFGKEILFSDCPVELQRLLTSYGYGN